MSDTTKSSISRPDLWKQAEKEVGFEAGTGIWGNYMIWRKYWALLHQSNPKRAD